MSRLFVSVLLSLTLLRPVGCLLLSLAQVSLARMEAAAKHPADSATQSFVFSRSDFRRRAVGRHEFWYNGKLYDWQTCEAQGPDSLRLQARADERESQGLAGLKALFPSDKAGQKSRGESPFSTLRLLSQPFLVDQPPCFERRIGTPSLRQCNWLPVRRLQGISPDIFSPPPERVRA